MHVNCCVTGKKRSQHIPSDVETIRRCSAGTSSAQGDPILSKELHSEDEASRDVPVFGLKKQHDSLRQSAFISPLDMDKAKRKLPIGRERKRRALVG